MQDSYKPTARFDAQKLLIAVLETLLGLIGAVTLILYFVTGSLSGAGQKADAAIAALWAVISSLAGK